MKKYFLLLISFLISISPVYSQQLAFPGAEGFGKFTTGGRGGAVIEVTNLNDKGEGSLRAAIQASGPRTVVFRISGTIFLESTLRINNDDITIAGQTAPGDGITIANYNFNVDASNVIIRYIRARMGDVRLQESDAFTCRDQENVIIDHCSFSWSTDEAASCYLNKNFTMQWCIISESLYNSVHSKGAHGYGGIWGGSRASFHHNLIAHHTSRTPRFNGSRYIGAPWEELVDFRNNFVYNWGFNSAYGGEPSEIDGTKANINMVNNYYKYGPATRTGEVQFRLASPDPQGSYGFSNWYIEGNKTEGFPLVFEDNWQYGVQGVTQTEKDAMRSLVPFEYEITTIHTADEAMQAVLQNAGVTIPRRDTIEKRIIHEATNGTATFGGSFGATSGIIDSQETVGSWPDLFTGKVPDDNDQDGMADSWEIIMGLNPDDPEDRNGDLNSDGYTNLEEYINSISPQTYFINPPTLPDVSLTDVTKTELNWQDNSGDEDGFFVERDGGNGYSLIANLPANTISFIDSLLDYSTSYTYRIQSYNDIDSSAYAVSNLITTPSETDPPFKSENPSPTIGLQSMPLSLTLSWSAGIAAESHKIYFGNSQTPEFLAETSDTFYLISDLEYSTKYYWRVDEVNSNGETTGDLWNFVTEFDMSDIMVGNWRLETISSAYDSSIFANHGTYYNFLPFAVTSNGAIGNAIKFNGINQYIRVPANDAFNFGINDFTIGFWIKQNPDLVIPSKEYQYILKGSRIANPANGNTGKAYEIYYHPASQEIRFRIDDQQIESLVTASAESFITNEWVYITAVRDKQNNELLLFRNGNPAGTATDNSGDLSMDEDLFFGHNPISNSFFNGVMDEIKMFNYKLNDSEILELVRMGPVNSIVHSEKDLRIFPNPASDYLFIAFDNPGNHFEIEISNLKGQVLIEEWFSLPEIKIDIQRLPKGIYVVGLRNSDGIKFRKLIIHR